MVTPLGTQLALSKAMSLDSSLQQLTQAFAESHAMNGHIDHRKIKLDSPEIIEMASQAITNVLEQTNFDPSGKTIGDLVEHLKTDDASNALGQINFYATENTFNRWSLTILDSLS